MELQCRETAEAFVESFNGRLRDECLNSHVFLGLGYARRKIRARVKDDKRTAVSQFAGYLTPIEFAAAARVS
jgi:putative transposase